MEKIDRGLNLPQGLKILHTSPHHDDEMLGYHPIMQQLVGTNQNTFVYITSGYRSVTDAFLMKCPDVLDNEEIHQLKRGGIDSERVNLMKGIVREREAEKMLAQLGVKKKDIHHLRSSFYDGGDPEKDAETLKRLIEEVKPDMITVLQDKEGLGPKTHHQSLEMIFRALKLSSIKPEIWFYRNVWSRFSLEEANVCIPVSNLQLEKMNEAFLSSFASQIIAAFPPKDFNGPFSKLAQSILCDQFKILEKVLGSSFFKDHPDKRVREAVGFIFLRVEKWPDH